LPTENYQDNLLVISPVNLQTMRMARQEIGRDREIKEK
jgi:hypothetical protein